MNPLGDRRIPQSFSSRMQLSQTHLTLLETCPRKFQHIYLDQLGPPSSAEQQDQFSWGSRFHLLMQQRELGLPIEALAAEHQPLHQWVAAFINAEADICGHPNPPAIGGQSPIVRQSEHLRTLYFQGFLLVIVCDLLILAPQQAQVLDWKTYARPQNSRWLARSWQTRLYPFVLAETSAYLPEQISMTYWFFQSSPDPGIPLEPQSWQFQYNSALHAQTQQELQHCLTQLSTWLEAYEHDPNAFPQVAPSASHCPTCPFAVRCQRHSFPESKDISVETLPSLDSIPEMAL
jgi:hypothetical protein